MQKISEDETICLVLSVFLSVLGEMRTSLGQPLAHNKWKTKSPFVA